MGSAVEPILVTVAGKSEQEVCFDELAVVLGLPRETMPSCTKEIPRLSPAKPAWKDVLTGVELTVEESEIVCDCFPGGRPQRSRNDAQFVGACLAHQRLQPFGKSWWHLDVKIFGPTSSNAGRSARWDLRGWWQRLYENLSMDGRLDPARLSEFKSLAKASEERRGRRV